MSQSISESLIKDKEQKSMLASNQKIRIFIFEAIGTFILAFGILCTQYITPLYLKLPNPFHDIFVSLSLYLAIVFCAPFSGGHFNPSVTCGFYFLKKENMSIGKFITYVTGQVLGATIGTIVAKATFDCEINPYTALLDNPVTLIGQGIGQFLGAFLFVFMILIVVHPNTTFTSEASWVQIFIPISLFVARSFSYKIGGVNPAVVSLIQIEGIVVNQIDPTTLWYIVVLDIFSILGAFTASKFYEKIHAPTFQKVTS